MKKSLKILLYFSIVLFIGILFISKDSTKKNEITKVVIEQERNISKKIETIEKVKEIEKEINQKPTVNAGDDQNITFGEEVSLNAVAKDSDGEVIDYLWKEGNKTLTQEQSFDYKFKRGVHHLNVTVTDNEGAKAEDNITVNAGYWKLVKVEIEDKSISYEYNNDKQIIKTVVDGKKYGKSKVLYQYDEKGREILSSEYHKNIGKETNISREFTDDGKLKEKSIIHSMDGEVYFFTKIIYGDKGNILKELGKRNMTSYQKEYHYSDTDQLLEIVGMSKGEKYIHIKYQYEDERLVSKRGSYREEEGVVDGEDYIYEDGILREVYHFSEHFSYRKFYNEDGLVEEKKQFRYGSLYQKIKYFYDEDGKKLKAEYYEKDSDGEFEQVSYTLFDDEKSQKIFLNSDKVEITYDKKLHLGTLVIEDRRDVYDEHGNLIEIWDDASDKLIERRFYRFVIEND